MNSPKLVEMELTPIVPLSRLARMSSCEITELIIRLFSAKPDTSLYMNQYQIFSTLGKLDFALEMQRKALGLSNVYRIAGANTPTIRLMALMGPGDSTDNTPLDYLIENSDIQLDLLYIEPGHTLPEFIPDHDIAIIALGESANNRPVIATIKGLVAHWPRPVLNHPKQILLCARDEFYRQMQSVPGLTVSPTVRLSRLELEQFVTTGNPPGHLLKNLSCESPITIRPIDTQGGKGLCKIESTAELSDYLETSNAQEYYVSLYIDYCSQDGLYRKVRVVLIDSIPYVCHLAISDHWIVHYRSANMLEDLKRREQEAQFMQDFDSDFGLRHQDAFRAIATRLALDYVVIDCAETNDGELLVFEADNRGWVHATDPVDIFPYKQVAMNKVFDAFRNMLLKHMHTNPA